MFVCRLGQRFGEGSWLPSGQWGKWIKVSFFSFWSQFQLEMLSFVPPCINSFNLAVFFTLFFSPLGLWSHHSLSWHPRVCCKLPLWFCAQGDLSVSAIPKEWWPLVPECLVLGLLWYGRWRVPASLTHLDDWVTFIVRCSLYMGSMDQEAISTGWAFSRNRKQISCSRLPE